MNTPLPLKPQLHPRNQHRERYDFAALINTLPGLAGFVRDNSIDFANPAAVKMLNQAILLHDYQIRAWDIPAGFLCPPIPGRVDYVHYLADLLGAPTSARVLDVGSGANCIYPLLGARIYGWQMVGSEINAQALQHAQKIVAANSDLAIQLRMQKQAQHIFHGIMLPGEQFSATMCNPPFHTSIHEAQQGTQRKWRNLGKHQQRPHTLNFGGQGAELWCPGGERAFIKTMITESARYARQCHWFTTLVSKAEHVPAILTMLKRAQVREHRIINMAQGQKQSRIVAWHF